MSTADLNLFLVTDDVAEATREITDFYAELRLDPLRRRRPRGTPTPRAQRRELERLNERFGHLCATGRIERTEPLAVEVDERDALEFERIKFRFAKHGYGELRAFIDTLNDLVISEETHPAHPSAP